MLACHQGVASAAGKQLVRLGTVPHCIQAQSWANLGDCGRDMDLSAPPATGRCALHGIVRWPMVEGTAGGMETCGVVCETVAAVEAIIAPLCIASGTRCGPTNVDGATTVAVVIPARGAMATTGLRITTWGDTGVGAACLTTVVAGATCCRATSPSEVLATTLCTYGAGDMGDLAPPIGIVAATATSGAPRATTTPAAMAAPSEALLPFGAVDAVAAPSFPTTSASAVTDAFNASDAGGTSVETPMLTTTACELEL